jgi:hypothetical protein
MGQTVAPARLQFKMPEKRRFRPKGPVQARHILSADG